MKPSSASFIHAVTTALQAAGFDHDAITHVVDGTHTGLPSTEDQPVIQALFHRAGGGDDPKLLQQLFALNEVLKRTHYSNDMRNHFFEHFHYAPISDLDVAEIGHGYTSLLSIPRVAAESARLFPLTGLFHSYDLIGQESSTAIANNDGFISLEQPLAKKYDYILGANVLTAGAVQLSDRYDRFKDNRAAESAMQIGDLTLALTHALKKDGAILHYGDHSEALGHPLLDDAFLAFGHLHVDAKKTEKEHQIKSVIAVITPTDEKRITQDEYNQWLESHQRQRAWSRSYGSSEIPASVVTGPKIRDIYDLPLQQTEQLSGR